MSCPVAQISTSNPNTMQNAKTLIDDVGSDDADPINDEYETSTASGNNSQGVSGIQVPGLVQTSPPAEISQDPIKVDETAASNSTTPTTSCILINESSIDYGISLSSHFTLGALSNACVFPHDIVAQRSLTITSIVCNLQSVSENVLEKIYIKYPGFRLNSGFRQGNGTSQHELGEAVDLQWIGIGYEEYWIRAQWVKNNIAFDQFIFEHGKMPWFHVSFKRNSGPLRRKVLTMYQNKFSNGLWKMF